MIHFICMSTFERRRRCERTAVRLTRPQRCTSDSPDTTTTTTTTTTNDSDNDDTNNNDNDNDTYIHIYIYMYMTYPSWEQPAPERATGDGRKIW